MKELGIIEGEYTCTREHDYKYGQDVYEIHSNEVDHIVTVWTALIEDCAENHAKLITDTFNTANKCNLLPSELLQRYNEAIEALEQIKDLCKPSNQNEFAIKSIAEQTISKAKGE